MADPDSDFSALFAAITDVPATVWDRAILDGDLLIRRVAPDRRARLSEMARRVGLQVAATHHGGEPLSPTARAQHLGLAIGDETGPLFASFTEPATIGLNHETIAAAEALLTRSGTAPRLGAVPLADVLVAHEIFHYWEMRLPDLPTSARQPDVLRLGPFRRAARLSSLGEIAAMAFAQELTGLPFSPFALTAALLWPQDRASAAAYCSQVRAGAVP